MNRFVIADPGRCIGCNTCMAACSSVHQAAGRQTLPRLTVTRTFDVTAPILCRHCEDAPCARVCPVDAITLKGDRVELNEQKCIGCKMCAVACPFGAITPSGTPVAGVTSLRVGRPSPSGAVDPLLSWSIGVKSVAVKCDLCDFQPSGPECVRVCPTDALHVMNDLSLEDEVAEKRLASAKASASLGATGLDMARSGLQSPATGERD